MIIIRVKSTKRGELMKYFYPAVFTYNEKADKFAAIFPDLPGCQAYGPTMEKTAKKARDALAASLLEMEEREIPIPFPSDEKLLQQRERQGKVCIILVDMESYRAFCAYKVKQAEKQSAEWAATARKGGALRFLARVFGR